MTTITASAAQYARGALQLGILFAVLQKYDTGRGFIPFIIILVLVLVAGPAAYLMPKNAGSLQPIVDGGYAALEAINANHGFLLFCSIGGAILSFIRKMLLV